jgi:hypothetical protein
MAFYRIGGVLTKGVRPETSFSPDRREHARHRGTFTDVRAKDGLAEAKVHQNLERLKTRGLQ